MSCPTCRKTVPFERAAHRKAPGCLPQQAAAVDTAPLPSDGGPKPHLRFAALGARKIVPLLGRGEEGAPRQHRMEYSIGDVPGRSPGGAKARPPKPFPPLGGPRGRVPGPGEEPSETGAHRPSRWERSAAQRPPAVAPATLPGSGAGGERSEGCGGTRAGGWRSEQGRDYRTETLRGGEQSRERGAAAGSRAGARSPGLEHGAENGTVRSPAGAGTAEQRLAGGAGQGSIALPAG